MNQPIQDGDILTTKDGREFRSAILKAQIKSTILRTQKNFLDKLPEKKKKEFYFKVYEKLQKQDMLDKKEPFIQMGLSPFTFMNEPLRMGNFQTTYGELFSRLHQALRETEGDFNLGDE